MSRDEEEGQGWRQGEQNVWGVKGEWTMDNEYTYATDSHTEDKV